MQKFVYDIESCVQYHFYLTIFLYILVFRKANEFDIPATAIVYN